MEWLWSGWSDLGIVLARAAVSLLACGVLLRMVGLRSLAKMSSTDFITTLAIGSTVAGIIMSLTTPLVPLVLALVALFAFQYSTSWLERNTPMGELLNNSPVLLMVGDEMFEGAMQHAQCTPADIHAKLREANVTHPDQILAVVMETTGDISVLHSKDPETHYDPELFEGVMGIGDKLDLAPKRFTPHPTGGMPNGSSS